MKKVTTLALALSVVNLLLTSCVPPGIVPYKFDKMEARVQGREVFFTLPEEDLAAKDKKYMLHSIGVGIHNCEGNCDIGWEMVRGIHSNVEPTEENFVNFPIKYGEPLPNMETREHTPLVPGRYTVGGFFWIYERGEYVGGKHVAASFTIE